MSSFDHKKIGGYSLIEVMVAIMIIGTSFVGLVGAFPYSLKIVKSAENRTRASYYAQEKIEELYQLGYDNIATGTVETKAALVGASPRASFQRETFVSLLDGELNAVATDAGLKLITSRVYYPHAFTKNESYFEVSTLISGR